MPGLSWAGAAVYEVLDSSWVAELTRQNRVRFPNSDVSKSPVAGRRVSASSLVVYCSSIVAGRSATGWGVGSVGAVR
jgi:hypothetical protein